MVADAGVDLIDIKEPSRGSLGAATPIVWREVVDEINGAVPLSVALGEFSDLSGFPSPSILEGIQYVKCGFSNCADQVECFRQWNEFTRDLPAQICPVSVIYADWKQAAAPSPSEVLGQSENALAVLVDTYLKDGSNLFDALSESELKEIIVQCQKRGQMVVLGGSLRGESIDRALGLRADFVAVRGAVCNENRSGEIDAKLVGELVKQVEQFNFNFVKTKR
jgi:uncharacterized protein (UPF0264 family)